MPTSTATVLFIDRTARAELHRRVCGVIERHRGTIVRNDDGGVLVTFASSSDGVAAAQGVQQVVDRANQVAAAGGSSTGPPLVVRAGLALGDIEVDGERCQGEAVDAAVALRDVAEVGQILATVLVQLATPLRDDARFVPHEPVALAGVAQPTHVVEVQWEPLEGWVAPLPAPLAGSRTAAFVGRSTELALLHQLHDAVVTNGDRAIVLVSGEPGIGKTTTVAHATREWHADGAQVALGGCDEHLRAPYRPFVEALEHLVRSAPDTLLEAHVHQHGAAALPLVRSLGWRLADMPAPPIEDQEAERYLLFAAVSDLLVRLAEAAPVVVFLDDLHWADAASASLLSHLAAERDPARLLVIGTYRDAEIRDDQPCGQALTALHGMPHVRHLHLDGLGAPDVATLVETWTGRELDQRGGRLVTDLLDETGGNAFFLTELLRHLDETGQLGELTSARGAGQRGVMPDSVREVVGARVGRLGVHAVDLLGTAAVIGHDFDIELLTTVTGDDRDSATAGLAEAAAAALVRQVRGQPGRYRFTHALVRSAVLANLGSTREVRLHRRIAEALEVAGGDGHAVQLAHHWLQATRHSDTARARDWARRAGDAALAGLAPADAVAYFRQALALHESVPEADVEDRIDLLVRLGTAQRLAGDAGHRETLLSAGHLAAERRDWPRLEAAVLANHSGTFSQFGGIDRDRVELLRLAAEHAKSDAQRAVLLGTLANELTYAGDYDERRRVADAALDAARRTGDDVLVLRTANLVFYALWVPDTLEERLALTEESLPTLRRSTDPLVRYWGLMAAYLNLVQAGQVTEADALLAELDAVAERLAQPALQWRARHTDACRSLVAGRYDEAAELAVAAEGLGLAAGEAVATVYCRSQLMCVHWQRGSFDELAGRIRGTASRPPNEASAISLIFAGGGRPDDARRVLDDQRARGTAVLPRDPALHATAAMFAEAAVLLDHVEVAEDLYALIEPMASQFGFDGVTTVGLLDHYVGALAAVLGERAEAIERLRRSVDVHRSIGAPFFEARSRVALARSLALGAAGERAEGREQARRAAKIATAHRFDGVKREAGALLA